MPASYPPRSAQRPIREDRRSQSGSRERRAHQQRPFSGYEEEREKETKWKRLRGHLVAMFSEFIGTTMFLWFAFAATQAAAQNGTTATSTEGLLFISLAFGFSLMVTVWAHYRISGGLFNPAVSHKPHCRIFAHCLGHTCTMYHQKCTMGTRSYAVTSPAPWRHSRGSPRLVHDPRAHCGRNSPL